MGAVVALVLAATGVSCLLAPARAAGRDRRGDDDQEPRPPRATDPAPEPPQSHQAITYETTVRGQPLRRLPADDPSGSTSVIEIRDPTPGTGLPELLAEVPGLRVKDAGPAGQRTLALRAAGSHQVAVFLDGVRLTPPGGGAVDLSLIDPAHLEVAEVRRSGGSARFGSDALGGALLLRTPRLRTTNRTSAAVGYGSFNALALRAAHGATAGRLRYLASGSFQRGDGDYPYVDGNGVARVRANNDFNAGELLVKLDRLGAGGRYRVALLNDLGLAERGAPGMSERPSNTARQRNVRNLTALQLSRFGALVAGSELRLSLFHRYDHFRFDEPAPPPVHSASHGFSLGGGGLLDLRLGSVGRLEAGFEIRGDLLRGIGLEAGDDQGSVPRRLSSDLWASSQTRLLRGDLVLSPVVRLAFASGFSPTPVPKLGAMLRPFGWLHRARQPHPQQGPVFVGLRRVLRALELTGNVGRSYRLPSFAEMYVRLEGFSGNVALAPEDALSADVGLRWRGRRLIAEVVHFRRRLSNTILFAPVSPVQVRPDNYSGVEVSGVEAAVELDPGLGLQLRGAYSYSQTRFGEPASRLPGHPAHRVVGRVGWVGRDCPLRLRRARSGRWLSGLQLWVQVVAESSMVLGRFDSLPEEGRVLLAAGASYSFRMLRVAAEGQNLLDKRDARDAVGFPLPPARFMVSLSTSL